MAVREFELFHGIVLAKLVRNDNPITLRMIETNPSENWGLYRLNDEVDLLIKHSVSPNDTEKGGKGRSWTFTFGKNQLRQMRDSTAKSGVYIALVGGSKQIDDLQKCVCLLQPEDVKKILDFSLFKQQSITISLIQGKSIRVKSGHQERFKVPQNRLDTWKIPGS